MFPLKYINLHFYQPISGQPANFINQWSPYDQRWYLLNTLCQWLRRISYNFLLFTISSALFKYFLQILKGNFWENKITIYLTYMQAIILKKLGFMFHVSYSMEIAQEDTHNRPFSWENNHKMTNVPQKNLNISILKQSTLEYVFMLIFTTFINNSHRNSHSNKHLLIGIE